MCAPRVNLLALWYLGFSVQAHIKCTEACPKNQALWEHLCSADVPLLLSVTGHTWAVCVAQAPRSCLVLKFPDCTQHMHWFMLRNLWSCSEATLCLASAITYAYWTICIGNYQGEQMFSTPASEILDISCASCKVSYAFPEMWEF